MGYDLPNMKGMLEKPSSTSMIVLLPLQFFRIADCNYQQEWLYNDTMSIMGYILGT